MSRILIPALGPTDWRRLLADPARQWRPGKSAFESAVAWEAAKRTARGLPPEVERLLDGSPAFGAARLLLGVPEHQVELDGGGHASQTDFWALIETASGVVSMAVEAKAGEPFDRPVNEWLEDASGRSGKPERLAQLCRILGLETVAVGGLRYQLMHRPVAAILEAKRFRLQRALFLVHAFGDNRDSLSDYVQWAAILGVAATENVMHRVGIRDGIDFWIAWLNSPVASPDTIRSAV